MRLIFLTIFILSIFLAMIHLDAVAAMTEQSQQIIVTDPFTLMLTKLEIAISEKNYLFAGILTFIITISVWFFTRKRINYKALIDIAKKLTKKEKEK